MTFFTQEAMFCPHCQTRFALGQFTRRELQHFAYQASLVEASQELETLGYVEDLFARYPEIEALHDSSSDWFAVRSSLEAWIREKIPGAAHWTFTVEDHAAIQYLSRHSFPRSSWLPGELKEVRTRLSRLRKRVNGTALDCPNCSLASLQLDRLQLAPEYLYALTHILGGANEAAEQDIKGGSGCMIILGLVALGGIRFGFEGLAVLCILLIILLAYNFGRLLWGMLLQNKSSKPLAEGKMEETIRGRYIDGSDGGFVWNPSSQKGLVKSSLLIAYEGGWNWRELPPEYADRGYTFSIFELVFGGIVINTGLVEVLEMISVELIHE